MKRTAAVTLGTTLLVVLLLVTLGFGLAGSSVTHLNLMARESNSRQATNLARSVVNRAVERLLYSSDYGTLGSEELSITLPGSAEGTGQLSFQSDSLSRLNVPHSTNNLEGTASLPDARGNPLAPGAVHLVGVGRSGGVTRTVDAVLHLPPFPYALVSSDPIESLGGLLVASLDPTTPRTGPFLNPSASELLPADLASNAPGQAIVLGTNTTITGDAQAVGQVVLDPNPASPIRVLGQVVNGASPVEIPTVNPSDYDPASLGRSSVGLSATYPNALNASGLSRRAGNLQVTGDLNLGGGLVFVDGDLNVSGALKGQGIVVVTGKTTVGAGADLQGANGVALISRGDISLSGSGKNGAYFQGTVYTEGTLQAEKISVVGAVVAHRPPGGAPGGIRLKEVNLFQSGTDAKIQVTLPPPPAPGGNPGSQFAMTGNGGTGQQANSNTNYGVTIKFSPNADGSIQVNVQSPTGSSSERLALDMLTYPATLDEAKQQLLDKFLEQLTPHLGELNGQYVTDGSPEQNGLADDILNMLDPIGTGGNVDPPDPPAPPQVITIDPSTMLRFADRIRFVRWQES